jgi:hypothetical protein
MNFVFLGAGIVGIAIIVEIIFREQRQEIRDQEHVDHSKSPSGPISKTAHHRHKGHRDPLRVLCVSVVAFAPAITMCLQIDPRPVVN